MDGDGRKRVAIAWQGGGSRTSFTAGALKRKVKQKGRYGDFTTNNVE